ncbi:MAG: hypothetical protein IJ428_05875 [Clostridia bacterium]|nr:hypothetical protein [Clostridia bacterium]
MHTDTRITAEYIKSHITMPEVIARYHHLGRHRRRTSCPIHGGENDNLGYDDKIFHCFTCGARGDVISFVMQLNGCDFAAAVRILDSDFHLGAAELTDTEREAAERRRRERDAEAARQREQTARNNAAFRIFAKYKHELRERTDVGTNPIIPPQIAWCDRQLDFIMDGGNYRDDPEAAVRAARDAVNEYSKRGAPFCG